MKDRIKNFIAAERLTPARFADIIGVQPATISHIISERNRPSLEFIQKMLASFPNLNPEWLIAGNGNMYKEQATPHIFETEKLPVNQNIAQENNNNQNDGTTVQSLGLFSENNTQSIEIEKNITDAKIQNREIEKIIICYSDKTFEFYFPL